MRNLKTNFANCPIHKGYTLTHFYINKFPDKKEKVVLCEKCQNLCLDQNTQTKIVPFELLFDKDKVSNIIIEKFRSLQEYFTQRKEELNKSFKLGIFKNNEKSAYLRKDKELFTLQKQLLIQIKSTLLRLNQDEFYSFQALKQIAFNYSYLCYYSPADFIEQNSKLSEYSRQSNFNFDLLIKEKVIFSSGYVGVQGVTLDSVKNILVIGTSTGMVKVYSSVTLKCLSTKQLSLTIILNIKISLKYDLVFICDQTNLHVGRIKNSQIIILKKIIKQDKYPVGILLLDDFNQIIVTYNNGLVIYFEMSSLKEIDAFHSLHSFLGCDILFIKKYDLIVFGGFRQVITMFDRKTKQLKFKLDSQNKGEFNSFAYFEKYDLLFCRSINGQIERWMKDPHKNDWRDLNIIQLEGCSLPILKAINNETQLLASSSKQLSIYDINTGQLMSYRTNHFDITSFFLDNYRKRLYLFSDATQSMISVYTY